MRANTKYPDMSQVSPLSECGLWKQINETPRGPRITNATCRSLVLYLSDDEPRRRREGGEARPRKPGGYAGQIAVGFIPSGADVDSRRGGARTTDKCATVQRTRISLSSLFGLAKGLSAAGRPFLE